MTHNFNNAFHYTDRTMCFTRKNSSQKIMRYHLRLRLDHLQINTSENAVVVGRVDSCIGKFLSTQARGLFLDIPYNQKAPKYRFNSHQHQIIQ